MNCKCGARTYEQHLAAADAGYPAHAFRGFVWSPADPGQTQAPPVPPAS